MKASETTRLLPGDVFELDARRRYRVLTVSESAAVCVPVDPVARDFETAGGRRVHFLKPGPVIRISPNSEVHIINHH